MSTKIGSKSRIALFAVLIAASAVIGAYVRAEAEETKKQEALIETVQATSAKDPRPVVEDEKRKALKKEFSEMRKEEYLKRVAEQEKYYRAMADEMKSVYKACGSEDADDCKKAKAHAKLTRSEYSEARKRNARRFDEKADEYRKKLGDTDPTDVELQHKELKSKKKVVKDEKDAE